MTLDSDSMAIPNAYISVNKWSTSNTQRLKNIFSNFSLLKKIPSDLWSSGVVELILILIIESCVYDVEEHPFLVEVPQQHDAQIGLSWGGFIFYIQ